MQGMSGKTTLTNSMSAAIEQIHSVHVNLSNPKPGHTTGGSGRGARRGGGAGPGRTGRRQNSSPRRQASLVPSKASKTRLLNVSPEARTSEILCKPNGGTKSAVDNAVYPRFITGTRSALRSWLPTSGPTPFCLCKPFSSQGCPGKFFSGQNVHSQYILRSAYDSKAFQLVF